MPFDLTPVSFDDLRAAFDAAKKAADRQTIARDAYAHAMGLGDAFDVDRWPDVATMLFEALPKARKGGTSTVDLPGDAPARFSPWVSHSPQLFRRGRPKDWQSVRCEVAFEGGRVIRASAVILPGKAMDVGIAARAACELYRAKGHPWGEVPPIVSFRVVETGEEFDPADACRETEDTRRAIERPEPGHSPAYQRRRALGRLSWFECPEAFARHEAEGFERADLRNLYARLFPGDDAPATHSKMEVVQPVGATHADLASVGEDAPRAGFDPGAGDETALALPAKTATNYVEKYVAATPRRPALARALMRSAAIPTRIAA